MFQFITCPFCDSKNNRFSNLPKNLFNGKIFNAHVCRDCRLTFIDPIPNNRDLDMMYPVSYQQGVSNMVVDENKKLPGLRVPYKVIFEKLVTEKSNPKVLDFGCGNGAFVFNAWKKGFDIEGTEFAAAQVEILKKAMPFVQFYTVDEVLLFTEKYDVVYLSNVLEHFTDCKAQFEDLLKLLKPSGIIIVEGPLEKNKSLINFCKWNYFILRKLFNKNYKTNFPPVHIFYSNYKNQLEFFESNQLVKLHYEVSENSWPYPEAIKDIAEVVDILKWAIAKTSKFFSLFLKKYGNTFVYVGRK